MVDRRHFLRALGASVAVGVAGCSSGDDLDLNTATATQTDNTPTVTESPTDSPTPTDAPTPTPTEEPTATERPPQHLGGLSGSTLPDGSNDSMHEREFTQSIGTEQTQYVMEIPDSLYEFYRSRPRVPDYSAYLAAHPDDELLQRFANTFEEYGDENGHSDVRVINHMIAWVQGLEYAQDRPATGYNEYPKYPVETLVDRGGDCEDTSILLAGVVSQFGYGARLIELPDAQHMAVGIAGEDGLPGSYYEAGGTQYYYVETTGEGWRIGEIPDRVSEQGASASLLPLADAPVLAMEWETTARPGELAVDLTIHNVGTRTAVGAEGQIDVEDRNENVVAQNSVSYPSIDQERGYTQQLTLDPPSDIDHRLRIGALLSGSLNDMTVTDFYSAAG